MSNSSGNWFSRLFKQVSQAEPKQDPDAVPKPAAEQNHQTGAIYKKGDFIGQKYEVYGVLGKGGFGVVYQVYSHELGKVCALKTFREEYLTDKEVRKRFHKEASIWVELGRHPYLVRANHVEEISGRLYIAMEYIAPNEEGLNSLEGYLQRRPPDLTQSLRWAVQICHGMEYAYFKGVRAHRDLKPANIMIGQDKTARITDFGLAGVISESPVAGWGAQAGRTGLSGQTMLGAGFGTPTHMAPEQFDNAAGCDERSDIYSFGIMLYQMAAGGRLPFPVLPIADYWQGMKRLHRETPVSRLDSPLFPILQRCLEKTPQQRYQAFEEVRKDLDELLQHQSGEVIPPLQMKELEAWEWNNKGTSLHSLGRTEEAIRCYNAALELDPRDAFAWVNKGTCLDSLGRTEEAIRCLDKALELDPALSATWNNKGNSLGSLARHEEAMRCYDQALILDPQCDNAWVNKGTCLDRLGRSEEAIQCYDKALGLDPLKKEVWINKGNSLILLRRYEKALVSFDKALEIDPYFVAAWTNKGRSLANLDYNEEAMRCFDKALELDPRYAVAWISKAFAEDKLNYLQEAKRSYQQFLALATTQYADQIEWARKRLGELGGM